MAELKVKPIYRNRSLQAGSPGFDVKIMHRLLVVQKMTFYIIAYNCTICKSFFKKAISFKNKKCAAELRTKNANSVVVCETNPTE